MGDGEGHYGCRESCWATTRRRGGVGLIWPPGGGATMRLIKLLLLVIATGVTMADRDGAAADAGLIARENARPGATDWQLTRVRLDKADGFRCPWIEGYCSKQSVKARRVDRHHGLDRPAAAVQDRDLPHGLLRRPRRPADDDARAVSRQAAAACRRSARRTSTSAAGRPTTRLTIPADWPSGVYLGRLTTLPPDEDDGARGRATSSSSSATTARPTSSSSAPTTPGRPTTAGPTTTRSTRTRRAARGRGPT